MKLAWASSYDRVRRNETHKSCVRNWKGLSSDHSTSPASSSARCTIAWLHDKSGPVLRSSPVSMAMDRTAKMLVSCVLSTIRSMKKWNGKICWTSWHLQYLTYHKKTQSYSEHSGLVLFPPITDLPHAPPFLSSSWTKNIKLKPFRPSRPNFWTVLSQLGLCKLFLPSNRSNSWWNMVRMVWRLWKFCIHPPKAMPCTSEQRAELWWSCSCGTLNGRHGLREAAQDGYETQVTDARQKNNKWTQQINQIMLYDMSYPIPLESSSIPIPWLILPQNPNVCWLNPR